MSNNQFFCVFLLVLSGSKLLQLATLAAKVADKLDNLTQGAFSEVTERCPFVINVSTVAMFS